jgi:hypothetical protein
MCDVHRFPPRFTLAGGFSAFLLDGLVANRSVGLQPESNYISGQVIVAGGGLII